MTATEKNKIIDNIMELLIQLTDEDEVSAPQTKDKPANTVEMLTIKECTEAVHGLSEHTVRKLVAQGKVKYLRTGEGKRGKILVNKADLIRLMQN